MGGTVEEMVLPLPILSGIDHQDAHTMPVELRSAGEVDLRSRRVAFYTRNRGVKPTPEIIAMVERIAKHFSSLGMHVEEALPPLMENSHELWIQLVGAGEGAAIEGLLEHLGTTKPHPITQQALKAMKRYKMNVAEFGAMMYQFDLYRSAMQGFMKGYDLILCPACAQPAMPLGVTWEDEYFPSFSYTIDYNFAGFPAGVVRAGTSPEGLPLGVQVVAAPWREDLVLAALLAVEQESGGWVAPPL